jgi:hypothetical protein
MSTTEWDQYFEHHDHDLDDGDHAVLGSMERHALCRRNGKCVSKFLFSTTPVPLLLITIQILATTSFDSGGMDVGQSYIYDYILGVVITSLLSLVSIVSYTILQLVDRHIINNFHGHPSDHNIHLTGDDGIGSFIVFLSAFINCSRGFIVSTSVESWQQGVSFERFRQFALETFFIQTIIFLFGIKHIAATTMHTFNMHVNNMEFEGTGTAGGTSKRGSCCGGGVHVDGSIGGCRPFFCCGCWGGPRTCACAVVSTVLSFSPYFQLFIFSQHTPHTPHNTHSLTLFLSILSISHHLVLVSFLFLFYRSSFRSFVLSSFQLSTFQPFNFLICSSFRALRQSQVCETGKLCFIPCCCKTMYRKGRSGRRALKDDYALLLQKKDQLTQQPGWRANVQLKQRIKDITLKCSEMKSEIKRRKLELNNAEEKMLGTVKYCQNLEDRKAANDWLMNSCSEWQGVSPKKQRFWNSRIRSLRKKVNVGGVQFQIGKIPRLSKKKKSLQDASSTTQKEYYRLKKWFVAEDMMLQRVQTAKIRLDQTISGHDTMGPEHLLTSNDIKRNNVQLKQSKKILNELRNELDVHRNIIDDKSKLPMSLAYDEIVRTMQLEKIVNHDAIVRLNLVLQAAVLKVNNIRTYRQKKFKQKLKYVRAMHGAAHDGPDTENVVVTAPCLITAPEVFWPQDLHSKDIDSPSTTMILRWQDPIDPDEYIEGYRLTVYKGGIGVSNVGGGSSGSSSSSSEKSGDVTIDMSGGIGGDGDSSFQLDRATSRSKIFFDDGLLIHKNDHKNGQGGFSTEVGSLMDAATGEYYNILRIMDLEPNREYKFTISTLTSLEMQQAKRKKTANFSFTASKRNTKNKKSNGKSTKEENTNKGSKNNTTKSSKRKKNKKDVRLSYQYEASRPSPLTISKSTCSDYPSQIESPTIEQYLETDSSSSSSNKLGASEYGYSIRWNRPTEYGIDIEGYRIELKDLTELDKQKKRRGSGAPAASIAASLAASSSTKEDEINRNSELQNEMDQALYENEKRFGSDLAGKWICVKTIPQDVDATHFSVKLKCGILDKFSLKPNKKYIFRINSYAYKEDDYNNSAMKKYLFHQFGLPTKEPTKTNPPKGQKQRKSYIDRAKASEKKEREAEAINAINKATENYRLRKKNTMSSSGLSKSTAASNHARHTVAPSTNTNIGPTDALIFASSTAAGTPDPKKKNTAQRGSMFARKTGKTGGIASLATAAKEKKAAAKKKGIGRNFSRQSMVALPSRKKFTISRSKKKNVVQSKEIELFTKEDDPTPVTTMVKNLNETKEEKLEITQKKIKKPGSRRLMLTRAAEKDEPDGMRGLL